MKTFGFLLLFFISASLIAQPTLQVQLHASGFTRPVKVVHANDDRLFVVEQVGRIKIIDAGGTTLATPFLDIQARVNDSGNEQGLLGLAFPPDYETSGVFYVNYTGGSGSGFTRISRFKKDPANNNLALADSEEILIQFNQPFSNHNGGDLNFGSDGFLYIGTGDGGSANDPGNRAQNLASYLGKILRIDVDTTVSYKIPATNPFFGQTDKIQEIWSYGLRNPWRFSFDRNTGDMWIGDVGQNIREEVDFEPANSPGGVNYGWKCYEGNNFYNPTPMADPCSGNNYTFPIFEYPHNNSTGGFSISGGYVYRGDLYPELNGNYICADYVSGNFWMISPNDATNNWMTFRQDDLLFDVSGFGENVAGELFITRLNGQIYRLSGDCTDSTVTFDIFLQNDTIFAETDAKNIVWTLNGTEIPNENGHFILLQGNGTYQCQGIANVSGCHYTAISNELFYLNCGDTTLEVTLTLINDTLKPNIETGTFVWYLNGEEISETQSFHIPLEVGEYYVEVSQDVEECVLFGVSDTITTECVLVECIATLSFENDTIFAQCAFGELTWLLDGNIIAVTSDEEPFLVPQESGTYTMQAYDSIAPYCVREDEASIEITITGLFNQTAKMLTLFPNPAVNTVRFKFAGQPENIKVFDAAGKLYPVTYSNTSGEIVLNISSLSKGVYFMELHAGFEKYAGQFVKE
jgi:glucose/arabinose dehydrogenase